MQRPIPNNSKLKIITLTPAKKRRSALLYLFLMVFFGAFTVFFILGGQYLGTVEVVSGYFDVRMVKAVDELKASIDFDEDVFGDISPDHPNYFAIMYMARKSIVKGYDGGEFRPDNAVIRAEFMKMLMGILQIYPHVIRFGYCFDDVADQWFAPYVCFGASNGWVDNEGGLFNPADEITVVEAVKVVAKALEIEVDENDGNGEWVTSYMDLLRERKWIGNLEMEGEEIDPHSAMTRAQVCELLFTVAVTEVPVL